MREFAGVRGVSCSQVDRVRLGDTCPYSIIHHIIIVGCCQVACRFCKLGEVGNTRELIVVYICTIHNKQSLFPSRKEMFLCSYLRDDEKETSLDSRLVFYILFLLSFFAMAVTIFAVVVFGATDATDTCFFLSDDVPQGTAYDNN